MGSDLSGNGWSPPPSVRDVVEFHWFHVPVGGAAVLCVLSAEPVWYVGHFSGGRMRRCRGDLCRHCVEGVGRQIRYVISAVDMASRVLGVIELGSAAMSAIRDRALARGVLRGMVIELARAARSKHGRLDVSVIDETAPSWATCMEALDCHFVLERTWERELGLDPKATSSKGGEFAHSERR